jgi:hypothetical protein
LGFFNRPGKTSCHATVLEIARDDSRKSRIIFNNEHTTKAWLEDMLRTQWSLLSAELRLSPAVRKHETPSLNGSSTSIGKILNKCSTWY